MANEKGNNTSSSSSSSNDEEDPNQSSTPSSSSWFGSWFERDMRGDIHEQLNAFETRKKEHEKAQQERLRFLEQQQQQQHYPSNHPFPFFFPSDHQTEQEFEDFWNGAPRWRQSEGSGGGDKQEKWRHRRRREQQQQQQQQQGIEDLHKELQSLFEAALSPSNTNTGWTSSSTMVSTSNGTSYTMKQDSKNGARVDLKLPKNCRSENVSLEVLRDEPCRIRWKNNNNNNMKKNNHQHQNAKHGQVLELGNSVDCSRLSASISEAHRTLTVKAPPRGNDKDRQLSLKPNTYPRPINVTQKP